MATTMLPPPELLPDVLPTDRLTASGKAKPEVREALRRIPNLANAWSVLFAWVQIIGAAVIAVRLNNPFVWVAAFLLAGRGFALLNILGHEAAHRLLFSRKPVNDRVGRWLLAYPAFTPIDQYRRAHMAHHRDEMGPEEPDVGLYAHYPVTPASLRRKLTRDAIGNSGWKNLKGLLKATRKAKVARTIIGVQLVIFAVCVAVGHPWLYLILWLAPWMTVWRVLNRLRAIAEHGGMTRSSDRRLTTHHVRQGFWARFWIAPYKTGWHLAHHVDIGIPFRHLPALHEELRHAGWVPDALEYKSYTSLWRALGSRADAELPATASA
jgi:fatty acid desaturase